MAGHSHWARIKHKKALTDKRRGKLWSKLVRAVIMAARGGGADIDHNLKLQYAVEKAKGANVPRDTLDRAVKKGAGQLEGENMEEALFEGYGPSGVAVLIETLTDNRNRTLNEFKRIFEGHGCSLAGAHAVAWIFDRKGLFTIPKGTLTEDQVLEAALDAGADEVAALGEVFEVTCAMSDFALVRAALAKRFEVASSDLSYLPKTRVPVDEAAARRLMGLLDELDEHDDTQNIHSNVEMSEAVERAVTGPA